MKRDKYSTEEWLTLIERYYDALTTPQEEELLKKIFDYWEVGDPESREADYVILDR